MDNQTPNRPTDDDSADWEAIARYFAGESTSEEANVVRRWLEAHPDEAAALTALGDVTADLAKATPLDLDVEAALANVTRRRQAEDAIAGATGADVIPIDSRRPARRTPMRPERTELPAAAARRWRRFAVPAAAAAVLLIGGRLVWNSTQNDR